MHATINAVTLAVGDLTKSKAFYEALGCELKQDTPQYVAFGLGDNSSGLSLYPRRALAKDAGVDANGSGFTGVVFNYFVADETAVDEALAQAEKAGGSIVRPAQNAQWGGYFGYLADLDGHLWKVVAAQG